MTGTRRYVGSKVDIENELGDALTPSRSDQAIGSQLLQARRKSECNHCRLSLNYPKGIASRCQPSPQFENWRPLADVPGSHGIRMISKGLLGLLSDREIARQMANVLAPFRD